MTLFQKDTKNFVKLSGLDSGHSQMSTHLMAPTHSQMSTQDNTWCSQDSPSLFPPSQNGIPENFKIQKLVKSNESFSRILQLIYGIKRY